MTLFRSAAQSARHQNEKGRSATSHPHREHGRERRGDAGVVAGAETAAYGQVGQSRIAQAQLDRRIAVGLGDRLGQRQAAERSEEHTSELQSLMRISYAASCLKKTK